MARATPRVEDATLIDPADTARAIVIGTPTWYTWLDGATTFAFVGVSGRFTAHKERRGSGEGYWKAYRKRAGVVRSVYLGKSADLTLERLQTAAATLAELALPEAAPARSGADRAPSDIAASVRAASALPAGTLTFCFTDIEGSTQLWEQHPQAMPAALVRHDAILRHAVAGHGGVVFKTVGDGVHAVFARARDALEAALAGQRGLQAEPWGATGPLRIRIALHTGAAELRDGDYFGPPLNRVARILALGHGGQIILSQITHDLVADDLPAQIELHTLGEYQLKDLTRPEPIFQLVSPDLPADFPPLRTLAAQPVRPAPNAAPLLATKLYIPAPRPQFVPRPRLMDRVQAGLQGKLTLIAAPAGFGKTTLVSEWRATPAGSPMLVAWVSLDADDNDPTRFWRYVIAALETVYPAIGTAAGALLQSLQQPPMDEVVTSLINAITPLPLDAALILDDYHLITTPAIHTAITFLLDHLPPHLHLIMLTRADPPLPLTRLRSRGELTELRAADLRFTIDEATAFLTVRMGLRLTSDEVAALEARTEGWVAGLQLAALAMQNRGDHAGFVAAFSGSNRFVVDYLVEEVLARQPPHLQTFLTQTAILDRICGPLCDALLGVTSNELQVTRSEAASLVTQASYSQLILDQLERANLFLVPLDDERHWYRYHHLFAEVLRSRLTSGASAETVATFHGRASVWYEQQGLIAEAVQHALAAHDWQRAADMIEAHGPGMALRGQVHIVLDWLNVLPDALMRMRPALCIIHALTLMFTDQLDAAEARLQDAERCVQPNMPPDQTQAILGRVAVIRANLVRYFGDLPRAVTLAQQALDLLPEADTIARAPAIIGVARIYLVSGDVTPAAERLAAAAVAPARASGNLLAFLSSVTNLARLQMMQGRLRQAAATFGDTTQLAPGPGRLEALVGSPAYYFGLGDLFREWNDLDAAEHHVAQGMNLVGGTLAVDADVVTLGYVAQAYVQHARRDTSGALATLEQFANLARQRNFVAPLIACGAATQAQLWLAQGQLAAAARWAEASGLQANDLNLPFPREAEYLTFARVQIALQRDGVAPPALADTVRLLDRLLVGAKANGRMGSVIELLMVRALALDAQGQLAEALSALEHALSLAEPEGYVRTFVDAGAPMAALLAQVARDTSPVATYAATLLVAFPEQYKETRRQGNKDYGSSNLASISPLLPFSPSPGLVEPLSAREREILQLIAGGLSNQAIADQLVVAASTVKKHINNIYGKLDVQSRTQALLRARELNLL